MSSSDDNDLISFIAGVVETMRDQMATKNDIGRLLNTLDGTTTSIRGDINSFTCDSQASNILCRLVPNTEGCGPLAALSYVLTRRGRDFAPSA